MPVIVFEACQRVCENAQRFVERHVVLGKIGGGLSRIPLKGQCHSQNVLASVCIRLTDIESAPLTGNVELSRNHSSQPGGALMKRSSKYVGLDVHQATTVSTIRDDTGRVLARMVVPTEADALLELFRGMRGAIHVALEEGTQAQWLHDLL